MFELWISQIEAINEYTKIELARKAWDAAYKLATNQEQETTAHLGGCI